MKKYLREIPGFRTGKKWKMVIALIFYALIISALSTIDQATARDEMIFGLQVLILIAVPFALIFNIAGLRSMMIKKNGKHRVIRSLFNFLMLIIITITVFIIPQSFQSEEQKKLNEISIAEATALELNNKISELKDIDTLTLNDKEMLRALSTEYRFLNEDAKTLVTEKDKLRQANDQIQKLEEEILLAAEKAEADKLAAEKAAADKLAAEKAAADKLEAEKEKVPVEEENVTADVQLETEHYWRLRDNSVDVINKFLKSPSTAKYPGNWLDPLDGWVIAQDGDVVQMASYVDSQNSFGATLRSQFYVQFRLNDQNTTPIYVVIDGEAAYDRR